MPNFIVRAIKIIKGEVKLIVPRSSRVDPIAWKRKYFREASDSCIQLQEEINGMKEIIFSSIAIQTIIQW